MLFILTNLLPAPCDSLSPACVIYTLIACHGKPGAELQNSPASLFLRCIRVLLCCVINSCAERSLIPENSYASSAPRPLPATPTSQPRVPLQLLVPWARSDSVHLTWPSRGLWFPFMRLELMDLDRSQGPVHFEGLCGRIASDFPLLFPSLSSQGPPFSLPHLEHVKYKWHLQERLQVPGKDFWSYFKASWCCSVANTNSLLRKPSVSPGEENYWYPFPDLCSWNEGNWLR